MMHKIHRDDDTRHRPGKLEFIVYNGHLTIYKNGRSVVQCDIDEDFIRQLSEAERDRED